MSRGVSSQAKPFYKKTQLKTLITFERVMVLTSNLVHIHIQKTFAGISIFYDDIFDAPFWVKSLYSEKNLSEYRNRIEISFLDQG